MKMIDKISDIIIGGIITAGFIYCVWLFLSAIDAHLTGQMNLWSENLGM